jgi:ABC-type amino acid transport substrate-binding protein
MPILKKLFLITAATFIFLNTHNPAAASTGNSLLKIGCSSDFKPYSFIDTNGHDAGLLVDYWKLWSATSGIPVKFFPMTIKDMHKAINNNEVDLLCGEYKWKNTEHRYNFSEPVMRMEAAVFIRRNLKIKKISNLNIPVGTVDGSLAHHYIETEFPDIKLQLFTTRRSLVDAMENGTLKAVVYDIPVSFPGYKFQPVVPGAYKYFYKLFEEPLRAVVKKGRTGLVDQINDGFAKMETSSKWEIASRWKIYQPERISDRTIILLILLSVLSLLGGLFYIFKLRKKLKYINPEQHNYKEMIARGENDFVEFKSTMRWDLKQQKVNKALEHVIIKTISAFMNAHGGTLFIGVDDEGNILGLDSDYNSFSKKKNSDGFLLALSSLINRYLGKKYHQFINARMQKIDGVDICIITVEPGDTPAFVVNGSNEEFFIRAQASSQPLGLKDTHEYITSRWPVK